MTLHAYNSFEPLGNTSIRAHPTLNHRKAFNITFRLISIHFFQPFEEYKYTYTPKLYISLNQSTSLLGLTYIHVISNLWRIHVYMHSKYMTSHKTHMHSSRLSLYICSVPFKLICILIHLAWNTLLKHVTHHHAMHALVMFLGF
jgi:hypothetical protein